MTKMIANPESIPIPLGMASVMVLWRGYGVKFHRNVGGQVYSLVVEGEATKFGSVAAARAAAREYHLGGDIQFVEVGP